MQKFDTPAPVTTFLTIPAGSVRFIATHRADTTVEVLPANPGKSRDVHAADDTKVDCANGVLRIESATKPQALGPSGSVEITVQLPTGSHVQAKAASAEFRTVGRLGNVTFDGAHGAVQVDEAASVHVTTADGNVEVGSLSGPAEISTARGDIRVAEAARGTVAMTTQSGNITVGAASGVSASLDARTTVGRVSNNLKNDGTPALTVHATTTQGDITAHSL